MSHRSERAREGVSPGLWITAAVICVLAGVEMLVIDLTTPAARFGDFALGVICGTCCVLAPLLFQAGLITRRRRGEKS